MNTSLSEKQTTSPTPDVSGTADKRGVLTRLYTGTGVLDVIGKRRRWFLITAVVVLICLASMLGRGFTLGIDFVGGSRIQFPAGHATVSQVEDVYHRTLGGKPEAVQTVGTGQSAEIVIDSKTLDQGDSERLQSALFDAFHPVGANGQPSRATISASDVSQTWGGQITRQALIALVVFLALVTVYITVRYERDMALAALATLCFDLIVTAGVYSLVGLEVTPATVIGMLTILGFSLYDSVVVFDKVEENTRGILHLTRRTYGEQANLAVNQTLMRSINTALIGALPIVGLLVIAVWLLGVGTLQDLALIQLVGLLVGSYSSIFFATPLLVTLKEKWGPVAAHTKKVQAKRAERAERSASRPVSGEALPDADTTGPIPAASPRPHRGPRPGPPPGARPTGKRDRRRR